MPSFAALVSHINKVMGANTIPDLSAVPDFRPDRAISTGHIVLDYVTGVWGFPRGNVTELVGQESTAKSTSAMQGCARCQRGIADYVKKAWLIPPKSVLWCDHESCFDPRYARKLGMDLSPGKFAVCQPFSLEQGFQIADAFITQCEELGMVVFDSAAAMVPAAELGEKAEIGDTQIGLQARAMAICLRQMKAKIGHANVAVVFINQLREKIDTGFAGRRMAAMGIKQETSPGGRALKHYADLRIEFRHKGFDKADELNPLSMETEKVTVGRKIQVTAVKNKVAAPWKTGEVYIMPDRGLFEPASIVDLAVRYQLFRQTGKASYELQAPFCSKGLGSETFSRAALEEYLYTNTQTTDFIRSKVMDALKGDTMELSPDEQAAVTAREAEDDKELVGEVQQQSSEIVAEAASLLE
jgi:recombination protein RecA